MMGEQGFRQKFAELLKQYGATITADDYYPGYPECGQDIQIHIEFDDWVLEDMKFKSFIDAEILTDD